MTVNFNTVKEIKDDGNSRSGSESAPLRPAVSSPPLSEEPFGVERSTQITSINETMNIEKMSPIYE